MKVLHILHQIYYQVLCVFYAALITFYNSLLLVFRNAIDFCILILFSATLLKCFVNLSNKYSLLSTAPHFIYFAFSVSLLKSQFSMHSGLECLGLLSFQDFEASEEILIDNILLLAGLNLNSCNKDIICFVLSLMFVKICALLC